jgi:hypothetical protein
LFSVVVPIRVVFEPVVVGAQVDGFVEVGVAAVFPVVLVVG